MKFGMIGGLDAPVDTQLGIIDLAVQKALIVVH